MNTWKDFIVVWICILVGVSGFVTFALGGYEWLSLILIFSGVGVAFVYVNKRSLDNIKQTKDDDHQIIIDQMK